MAKFDPVEEHKLIGYCVKIKGHDQLNGVTVEIPSNIILDKPKQNITYYVEDTGTRDGLTVYVNNVKYKTYKISKKITKLIIAIDILQRIKDVEISNKIVFGESKDGVDFPKGSDVFDIVMGIMNESETEEEKALLHHIRALLTDSTEEVPEDLIDYYNKILCHDFME